MGDACSAGQPQHSLPRIQKFPAFNLQANETAIVIAVKLMNIITPILLAAQIYPFIANWMIGWHEAHRHLLAKTDAKADPSLVKTPTAPNCNIRVKVPEIFSRNPSLENAVHEFGLKLSKVGGGFEKLKA